MVPPATDLDRALADAGFPPWTEVVGRASVATALGRWPSRSGVYVLGFADGSRYVGRSGDALRRYDQHRHHHGDITLLTFRPVAEDDQADVERALIHALERAGVRLRNKAEMSVVAGPSSLDALVDPAAQERWLATGEQPVDDGPALRDDDLRPRQRADFDRFRRLAVSDGVLRVLGRYLEVGLPSPRRTELTSWSASCLPAPGRVLVRLNLSMQEVLTVVAEPPSFFVSLHLARSPFEEHLGPRWRRILEAEGYEVGLHRYSPGGHDQFNLIAVGEDATTALLASAVAAEAVRTLNLRLMRKGRSYWRGSHCSDLVDAARAAVGVGDRALAG